MGLEGWVSLELELIQQVYYSSRIQKNWGLMDNISNTKALAGILGPVGVQEWYIT